ncbi:glutamate receptor ionotropic, kainate 2-like isoform X2 [Zophobas morio]|uniref:glutamate receptor ionotropic, kainate 2-like isoform X2 n=1 Tax=Zophobas morio TaxID=2755281 RepID=UPI003083A1FD
MEKFIYYFVLLNNVFLTKGTLNIGFYIKDNIKNEIKPMLLNSIMMKAAYNKKETVNFVVESMTVEDSFQSNQVPIIASESEAASPMIQSITCKLNIPYIQTNWRQYNSYLGRETSLNLHPDFNLLSLGLAKIVESLQWPSFIVLYENFQGFLRLQEVFKLQKYSDIQARNTIIIKKLNFQEDVRSVLKEIKHSGEKQIIVDCETENTLQVLEQAKEVGLMTFAHTYFLSSLDAHTLNLEKLNTEANITTVRVIDPNGDYVKEVLNNMLTSNSYMLKTETVLIHESINLLMQAVNYMYHDRNITSKNISCKGQEKFKYGSDIISYIKNHYTKSSSRLPFDQNGRRVDFTLYLVEGNREKVIATWDSIRPDIVNFFRTAEESYKKRVETLQTRVQNISSRLESPYLMLKKDHENQMGNDKFEGYVLDLMTKIAEKLNFKFNIKVVQGGSNGLYNELAQTWDGIIGDIINENAQFGISDLTITPSRESVVDFSMPFMRLGIGILLQKPKTTVSMFAFLNPLSAEVWMYTVTLYLTVSVILYFVARMAPGDWENPHPCNLNPDELENLWSISNCLWLTMGSIMNQGSDILPKGISSRLVTSMWWFFALIMTNSYIASLAAFLTAKGSVIDDLEDLAKQNKIKYGTLDGGSTQEFFKQSNYSTYRRMYANMILNLPSVFAKTTHEGVQRVQNTPDGSYAFLMESTTIDYLVERNCELTTVDKWFNNIEYGIAMPLDCPYRTIINDAILALQENGELNDLKNKWWREESSVCVIPHEGSELRLENVGGIFVVLGLGVAVALFLGLMEFLWTVRQTSIEEHITYWQAFKMEILFALKVWISKKKIKQLENSNHSVKSNVECWSQWGLEQSEERQSG